MNFEFPYVAIAIIGFLVLLPWVLGPIMVYLKSELSSRFEFYPLTDAEIASSTTTRFLSHSGEIEALGFERVANLQSINNGVQIFTRLFHNSRTQEAAHLSEFITSIEGSTTPPFTTHMTEFATYYFDGTEIDTNNGKLPNVTYPNPDKVVTSLPQVEEPAIIYQVHRRRSANVGREVKPLPPRHLVEQELEIEILRTFNRQTEFGYFYLDEAHSTFRPTVKGAILMAWKTIWPVGAIRRDKMRRDAARILQSVSS